MILTPPIHEQSISNSKSLKIQNQLNIAIATWNLQGTVPQKHVVKMLMNQLISGYSKNNSPDIIHIATQQCERSLSAAFFYESKQQWENLLVQCTQQNYQMMETQTLQGLHSAIFVKKSLVDCYTRQNKDVYRAGTCNILGNKGATTITCNLLGQNIQFINCHLAPHQNDNERRNEVLLAIINNVAQKDTSVQVFLCGDLNYRIQMTKQQYRNIQKKQLLNVESEIHYTKSLNKDQLKNQQILKQRFLPKYEEGAIDFPPTYKLQDDGPEYNHTRIPGWTDRIFMRKGRAKQLFYSCMYDLYGSDHRPVLSGYSLSTEQGISIFPEQLVLVNSGNKCQLI